MPMPLQKWQTQCDALKDQNWTLGTKGLHTRKSSFGCDSLVYV